jgi:hypothetical protein
MLSNLPMHCDPATVLLGWWGNPSDESLRVEAELVAEADVSALAFRSTDGILHTAGL